jgi:Leucine-rich repeat (LRR) protein
MAMRMHRCVVAFTLALLVCASANTDFESDRNALIDLFWSTNGAEWSTSTDWLSNSSMCSWFGVSCDCSQITNQCRVSQLSLGQNFLTGPLPDSFSRLTGLTVLDLQNNHLNGTVVDMSQFQLITSLNLNYNYMTGCFSVQNLTQLEYLNLGINYFQCNFTEANVTSLPLLKYLDLNTNRFSGLLPNFSVQIGLQFLDLGTNLFFGPISEYSHLPALQVLRLHSNHLSGTVPEFTHLTNLTSLQLQYNGLSGSVPSFNTLINLQYLFLAGNQLTNLPRFDALISLQYIDLSANNIVGTMHNFERNTNMQYIDLHSNRLSGSIPDLSHLSSLSLIFLSKNAFESNFPVLSNPMLFEIDAADNSLNGSITDTFQFLPSLYYLDLSSNLFSGSLPQFNTTGLGVMYLYNNSFAGSIPEMYSNFSNLVIFDLSHNQLEGSCPQFSGAPNLQVLNLNSNQLSGTLPEFSVLSNLATLRLDFNNLHETIPNFFLPSLQFLFLGNNSLSGSVPTFEGLSNLIMLYLSDNLLTGTLPRFDNLIKLQILMVQHNSLSGPIPDLSHLNQSLWNFDINTNRFSGTVPSSLQRLTNLRRFDAHKNLLSGELHCFESSDSTPALTASYVNLSSNRFTRFGRLAESHNVTVLDLRYNGFLCPFPQFPIDPPLVVLRSLCAYDWDTLGLYLGIGAGAGAVAAVLFLLVKRVLAERTLKLGMFTLIWLAGVGSVLTNGIAYRSMIDYLSVFTDNCRPINFIRVFSGAIAVPVLSLHIGGSGETSPLSASNLPPNYLFSQWINSGSWLNFDNYRSLVQTNIAAFTQLCTGAPECSYDASTFSCQLTRPELASSGGAAHQTFLVVVIVFISLRVLYELFSLVLIVVSCVRCTLFGRRVFMQSSMFLPLLLLRSSLRQVFVNDMVLMEAQPSDYLLRLLTNGLFNTGPMLIANLYYLLAVVQTGLDASSWASLLLGVLMLPQLIGQAFFSWRSSKLVHLQLQEDAHHRERAESGAVFELSDLAIPPMPAVLSAVAARSSDVPLPPVLVDLRTSM